MRFVLVAALCATMPAATVTRTVVVSVQDPLGNLIPNLRPENFAVYEGGVRQRDVIADVVHAPITLAVLIEGGGRYQAINKTFSAGGKAPSAADRAPLSTADRAPVACFETDPMEVNRPA